MLAGLRWSLYLFFSTSANALIFSIPSTTISPGTFQVTYTSEASDPVGIMQFWLGHDNGAGGFFHGASNIPQSQTPIKVEVTIPSTAVDGNKWAVYAGPGNTNFPQGLFGKSDLFNIVDPASSAPASSSAPISSSSQPPLTPSNPNPSGSTSILPSISPLNSSTGSLIAKSSDVSSTGSSRTSAPSPGLIAGVLVGVLIFLLIIILLLLYIRRLRRRSVIPGLDGRAELDPEPGFTPYSSPISTTSRGPVSFSTSLPPGGPRARSNTTTTSTTELPLGSKAATARQEYLTNQLATVQAQLAALQRSGSDSDPSYSGSRGLYPRNPDPGTQLREQNAALYARIQMLESQLQSQWALGLSDEAPPGYME
ncbi:hypothetical protein MIND_00625200 [Mycena indigotica]|uniref:Uncharacterized protein n=1 Tax=Mycena indigotica TaxID=2126181 RepID=A0A8H6SRY5_9AGAR|nr:uncharacterized protein MIND_00625200 [Mycena indigotica]KAF7303945.1 hypothetical protein MIND_00625200 [Mycena indigotica]